MRRPRTTPQKSTLCGWVITIFPCSSAYSCHAHMNHGCISTDMLSQEFPCVRLKDMQVKDSTGGYWLWEALPAEALVLLKCQTQHTQIQVHQSQQVTMNLPSRYLTHWWQPSPTCSFWTWMLAVMGHAPVLSQAPLETTLNSLSAGALLQLFPHGMAQSWHCGFSKSVAMLKTSSFRLVLPGTCALPPMVRTADWLATYFSSV